MVMYVARLIENEFLRFSTLQTIITNIVIHEDIELERYAKSLSERGVEAHMPGENGQGPKSPLFDNMANFVIAKLNGLFAESFI